MILFGPLYERVLLWSRHPHAERYLGAMSFAESSFFPIPVDVMLAPMCLADRDQWIRYAAIATVFSVLGGLAGYAIGYGMFEAIEPWLRDSHYWDAYETSRRWFDEYGVLVVFVAGFSPIPYKVFTIAAGANESCDEKEPCCATDERGEKEPRHAQYCHSGGERFETTLSRHIERVGWAVVAASALLIAWLMLRG